jgi:hypothetical protein
VTTTNHIVNVPDFLRDLLAKNVGLTRELTCNGSRPPLYIDKGLRPIEPPQSIKSILLTIFTLCIRSSSSLASLYHEFSSLFGFMSIRGVLGGLPTPPRHTLGPLLPDMVYTCPIVRAGPARPEHALAQPDYGVPRHGTDTPSCRAGLARGLEEEPRPGTPAVTWVGPGLEHGKPISACRARAI